MNVSTYPTLMAKLMQPFEKIFFKWIGWIFQLVSNTFYLVKKYVILQWIIVCAPMLINNLSDQRGLKAIVWYLDECFLYLHWLCRSLKWFLKRWIETKKRNIYSKYRQCLRNLNLSFLPLVFENLIINSNRFFECSLN